MRNLKAKYMTQPGMIIPRQVQERIAQVAAQSETAAALGPKPTEAVAATRTVARLEQKKNPVLVYLASVYAMADKTVSSDAASLPPPVQQQQPPVSSTPQQPPATETKAETPAAAAQPPPPTPIAAPNKSSSLNRLSVKELSERYQELKKISVPGQREAKASELKPQLLDTFASGVSSDDAKLIMKMYTEIEQEIEALSVGQQEYVNELIAAGQISAESGNVLRTIYAERHLDTPARLVSEYVMASAHKARSQKDVEMQERQQTPSFF